MPKGYRPYSTRLVAIASFVEYDDNTLASISRAKYKAIAIFSDKDFKKATVQYKLD